MSYVEQSREPLRPIVDDPARLAECLDALRAADGPVAFDTERAHGHRYFPKAYLLQIRREGAGTWLIDPIAFESDGPADLGCLVDATGDAVWLIHAASQDLPCMREINIVPPRVFDTELAARLLGKAGASLGFLLESELGIKLRKAHSADNWSKRPLPESWLTYAALDVDYLLELAEVLERDLRGAGRLDWAEQEFDEALRRYSAEPEPKVDPWRRLSGITALKSPRQYAVAKALWLKRDAIAQRRDRPPTWILSDAAIMEVAQRSREAVASRADLEAAARGKDGQRYLPNWISALDEVRAMPEKQYPPRRAPRQGLPNPRSWDQINPEAAARWAKVRPVVDVLACDLGGLQASLVGPPAVLQEALFHHSSVDRDLLISLGARPWQADFLAPAIAEALED